MKNQEQLCQLVGLKPPPESLTITPRVIQSAESTFLFASGQEKGRILAKALEQSDDIVSILFRLVLGATWVLDSDTAENFAYYRKSKKVLTIHLQAT